MDKVPKKITPAKVRVVKKAKVESEVVLPVKKIVSKKSAGVKSKSATKLTKKLPVKKVTNKAKQDFDEVKLVPGTISQRLLEKRKLYERVYQDYVPKVMRPIAITGGYAYVTIGIFLALLMANPALSNLVSQSASVLCFAGDCKIASSTEQVAKQTIVPAEFVPLGSIVPGTDTNLQLNLNISIPVRLTLLPIEGGETLTIAGVAEPVSNVVNFILPTATLTNGSYLVQAELFDEETKQTRVKLNGPTIVVANEVVPVATSTTESVVTETVLEEEVLDQGEVLGVSTSSTAIEEEVIEEEELSEVESNEELALAVVEKEVEVINIAPSKESEVFALTITPGITQNQSVLKILPTFVFDKVELAINLKGDGETFFLGQATKADDAWFYWLDNSAIPNGSYSLIVRGFDNGEFSEEASFTLTNMVEPSLTKDADRNEIESRVNSLLGEGTDIEELRELRASYVTSYLEARKEDYSDDYLADYLPKFDRLFAKYASAIAGGTDALVILADDQIEKYLDTVIVDGAENSESFGQELTALLLDIKQSIQTKEAEVAKLSGGDSAFDIDKDGLTDYDEVVIYDTDPKLSDTDNDGIIDSIEVILGYTPNDAKFEAVSRIADDVDAGVLNGDLLAILAVEPFYLYTDTDSNPKVLTSVSGKGIPNSFARLYLGDSPESIIVKVGPDGTFTQTIDKDFVKIQGEVVLAVTDNTGRIVMRGQPLQLGKAITSRQLFNPVAIDAAVIKSVEEFKTINIIGAVGVVSFGLILLLLGKALVPRREPVSLEIA